MIIHSLQGQAYLLVIVMDVDRNTLDDAVDAILITILPSSLKRYSQTERFPGLFGFGSFTLRYRVDCQDDFHGEGLGVSECESMSMFVTVRLPPSLFLSLSLAHTHISH